MAKIWVDPPSGWQYGFPKLYDPEKDGVLDEWMFSHGYPRIDYGHVRMWDAEEKEIVQDE